MTTIIFYLLFLVVENLKGKYAGQKLNNPVANGMIPINPNQLSKITPKMAIPKPNTIRNNLSTDPTLHFIFFYFKFVLKQKQPAFGSKVFFK